MSTAALLGRSSHRAEPFTDTPIFHALATAATPTFPATRTARETIHRPPTPPVAVPSPATAARSQKGWTGLTANR